MCLGYLRQLILLVNIRIIRAIGIFSSFYHLFRLLPEATKDFVSRIKKTLTTGNHLLALLY